MVPALFKGLWLMRTCIGVHKWQLAGDHRTHISSLGFALQLLEIILLVQDFLIQVADTVESLCEGGGCSRPVVRPRKRTAKMVAH